MATHGASSVTKAINRPKPIRWQAATVVSIRQQTPRVKTIEFDVRDWPGHLPGQHVDVRLTAEDGYRAERSYSIASPPEVSGVHITVDRLEDGEVSPFLTGELTPGDIIEVRGPIGGHFAWSVADASHPLLLVGGGSGVVPLMCMLRHRRLRGSSVPAALLYSARTREDVIYRDELTEMAQSDSEFRLHITLTREDPPGWPGGLGRIALPHVQAHIEALGGLADTFICGGDNFVEAAATLLLQAGQPAESVRTERFGAAGT